MSHSGQVLKATGGCVPRWIPVSLQACNMSDLARIPADSPQGRTEPCAMLQQSRHVEAPIAAGSQHNKPRYESSSTLTTNHVLLYSAAVGNEAAPVVFW